MCVAAHFETLFTASSTDVQIKHRCIFVQCKSVSLKMCSRHVVCIIHIHMPCRLLVLHTPLYTNIVDRQSGPFGGDLDKNAKN